MRIIIEDTQSVVQSHPAELEPTSLSDGGAAPGPLLPLGGAPGQLQAGQVGEIEDAGPPPPWLVEAVSKAVSANPGRFEILSPPGGELEPGPDAVDGGQAPDLSGDTD